MRNDLRVKFPDDQGKYREFSRFRASLTRFAPEKASSSFGFLSKFPTQPNRELFSSNWEFNRVYQGIFLRRTEKTFCGSFDAMNRASERQLYLVNLSTG